MFSNQKVGEWTGNMDAQMPSRLENDPENLRRSCMQHSIQQFWGGFGMTSHLSYRKIEFGAKCNFSLFFKEKKKKKETARVSFLSFIRVDTSRGVFKLTKSFFPWERERRVRLDGMPSA
jgi:hypothetical protein